MPTHTPSNPFTDGTIYNAAIARPGVSAEISLPADPTAATDAQCGLQLAAARAAVAASLADMRMTAVREFTASFDAARAQRDASAAAAAATASTGSDSAAATEAKVAVAGGGDDGSGLTVTATTTDAELWEAARATEVAYAAKTLLMYLRNITKDPTKSTYRRISITNAAFRRISQVPGVERLFTALGFESRPPFYELSADPVLPLGLTTVFQLANNSMGSAEMDEWCTKAKEAVFAARLTVVGEVLQSVSELQTELALGPRGGSVEMPPPLE